MLAYNIPVILWGAYVRASFSGDGCRAYWPFCNGSVLPQHMAAPMAIEFTHRAMTSVDMIMVIGLCVWAFLVFPRKHAVRLYVVLSLVFLFVEALLGAGLVLLRYVSRDQSAGRVWYLSAHLTNTMLLLGALTITACLASKNLEHVQFRRVPRGLIAAPAIVVFVSITGVVAALGDMLYPASSLGGGMQEDFSSASSVLLRLRMIHPLIAIVGAAYIIWAAWRILNRGASGAARRTAAYVVTLTAFQLAVGAVNLSLLAPLWMQLSHLFVADLLWISLIALLVETVTLLDTPVDQDSLPEQAVHHIE